MRHIVLTEFTDAPISYRDLGCLMKDGSTDMSVSDIAGTRPEEEQDQLVLNSDLGCSNS